MNKIKLFVKYNFLLTEKEFVELWKTRDDLIIRLNCNLDGYKYRSSGSKRLINFCMKYTCNPY